MLDYQNPDERPALPDRDGPLVPGIVEEPAPPDYGPLVTYSRHGLRVLDRAPATPERSRLVPVPFDQIQITTNPPYLVKEFIPREGLSVAWGPPKCGKSFWAFDLMMHVALGWEYRGRRITQGPVVYVACEGAHGFRARIEAFRQRHLAEQAEGIPFFLIPATIDLVGEVHELIAAINTVMAETKPIAVVLDTLMADAVVTLIGKADVLEGGVSDRIEEIVEPDYRGLGKFRRMAEANKAKASKETAKDRGKAQDGDDDEAEETVH